MYLRTPVEMSGWDKLLSAVLTEGMDHLGKGFPSYKHDLVTVINGISSIAFQVMDVSSTGYHNIIFLYSPSVWLVTPLISKLSESVLGRVLKSAGNVLGQGQWWNPEKNQEKRRATRATR